MAKYTKIDVRRFGARNGADSYDLLQSLINNNQGKKIIIPSGMECAVRRVLNIPSNTCLEINGVLKAMDGHVRPLTQDAAIGSKTLYVENANQYFKVGQFVAASSDTYPTAGSGNVPRRIGQCGEIEEVHSDRIVLKYPLQPSLINVALHDLLVSDNAMVGHSASILQLDTVDNVTIQGTGTIDARYPTMHSVYPYSLDEESPYFKLEEIRAGNAIVSHDCTNLTIKGVRGGKLTVKESNIATLMISHLEGFWFQNLVFDHPYMKHLAFATAEHGFAENIDMMGSYNEDGLSLHDNVTYSRFRNFFIQDCQRAALLVNAGSNYNSFENFLIKTSRLTLYSYPGTTSPGVTGNRFRNIIIEDSTAGPVLAMTTDTVFENLQVHRISASGHMITFYGGCDNVVFNGGGCYDTLNVNRNGRGINLQPPMAWHGGESQATFNNFEFKRVKKALENNGSEATITLNECVFEDNFENGDLDDPSFILVDCIVDGEPYSS